MLLPDVRRHRRRRLRQGRRRQVHRRGQPRGGAGAARAEGRAAGRRHLRPQPAAHARPAAQARRCEGDKMLPLPAWGLSAMSIGFLVEEETPMIWRGPMVMGALEQMMGQVAWGRARHHDRRHAARHRRRAAHHGAAGRPGRRGDRLHAAGHRAAGRPPRRAHVRAHARAGARADREHELFLLPELRPPRRNFRPWRRPPGSATGWAANSSARCRCCWISAPPADAGTPIVAADPASAAAQAFAAIAARHLGEGAGAGRRGAADVIG